MNNRTFILALLGFVMAIGALLFSTDRLFSQGDSPPDVIKHLNQLLEATGSYRADVKIVMRDDVKTTIREGDFTFKWPNLMRLDTRVVEDGSPLATIVSDGTIKWHYMPSVKFAFKYDLTAFDEDAQQKFGTSADYYDIETLTYLERDQVGTEDVYVFEVQPMESIKQEDPEHRGNARTYISVNDGTLRRTVTYGQEGNETNIHTYSNVRKDASISMRDFEFVPPAGTQVVEVNDTGVVRIPVKPTGTSPP